MTAPLPPMSNETKAGRTLWSVLRPAWTSVLKGDVGCSGTQAMDVDHSTQSLRCRGGDTDMSKMAGRMSRAS